MKFPNHEIPEKILIKIFYRALYQHNKDKVDNVFGGSFIKSPYVVVSKVLDKVIILSEGWDMKDVKVTLEDFSLSFVYQEKKGKRGRRMKIW